MKKKKFKIFSNPAIYVQFDFSHRALLNEVKFGEYFIYLFKKALNENLKHEKKLLYFKLLEP